MIWTAGLRLDLQGLFDLRTVYNQWTMFPVGFDPVAQGLTLAPSPLAIG
jgi:hypothetical protein